MRSERESISICRHKHDLHMKESDGQRIGIHDILMEHIVEVSCSQYLRATGAPA